MVSGWLCLGTTVLIKTNEKEGKASKSSGQWRAVKGFEAFVFGHRLSSVKARFRFNSFQFIQEGQA